VSTSTEELITELPVDRTVPGRPERPF